MDSYWQTFPKLAGSAETGAVVAAIQEHLLELVQIANPRVICNRGRMHSFAFDGFVMYTFECQSTDFDHGVEDLVEFSNQPWSIEERDLNAVHD